MCVFVVYNDEPLCQRCNEDSACGVFGVAQEELCPSCALTEHDKELYESEAFDAVY